MSTGRLPIDIYQVHLHGPLVYGPYEIYICPVANPSRYSNPGGTRRFVACSNAYPSSIRRGSLQAIPVKLTPNGPGLASNPSGNGGVAEFGTIPNGTTRVGYPG